jgi:hypothetical protein
MKKSYAKITLDVKLALKNQGYSQAQINKVVDALHLNLLNQLINDTNDEQFNTLFREAINILSGTNEIKTPEIVNEIPKNARPVKKLTKILKKQDDANDDKDRIKNIPIIHYTPNSEPGHADWEKTEDGGFRYNPKKEPGEQPKKESTSSRVEDEQKKVDDLKNDADKEKNQSKRSSVLDKAIEQFIHTIEGFKHWFETTNSTTTGPLNQTPVQKMFRLIPQELLKNFEELNKTEKILVGSLSHLRNSVDNNNKTYLGMMRSASGEGIKGFGQLIKEWRQQKSFNLGQMISARNIFGVEKGSGTLLDRVLTNREVKKEIQQESRQQRQQFTKNFARYSDVGAEMSSQGRSRRDIEKVALQYLDKIIDNEKKIYELEQKKAARGGSLNEKDAAQIVYLQKINESLRAGEKQRKEDADKAQYKDEEHHEEQVQEQKGFMARLDKLFGRIGIGSKKQKSDNSMGKEAATGSFLGNAISGTGTSLLGGLVKGIKGLFSFLGAALLALGPSLIASVATGGAVLALIVGLFGGLTKGLKEYMKTGNLHKAWEEGVLGFARTITLGFFSKEKLARLYNWISDMWDDWILHPMEKLFNDPKYYIKNIVPLLRDKIEDGLLAVGKGLIDLFKGIFSMIYDAISNISPTKLLKDAWKLGKAVIKGDADMAKYIFGDVSKEDEAEHQKKQGSLYETWSKERMAKESYRQDFNKTNIENDPDKNKGILDGFKDDWSDILSTMHPADGMNRLDQYITPLPGSAPDIIRMKSQENQMLQQQMKNSPSIISAPITNINKNDVNTVVVKPMVRNIEPSLNRYFDKKLDPNPVISY